MKWTMPYPWRSRRDSVRRINMSSEPGNESFFCALRPIPRILSLRRRDYASQVQIGVGVEDCRNWGVARGLGQYLGYTKRGKTRRLAKRVSGVWVPEIVADRFRKFWQTQCH